jgi:hypothetical protein
MKTPHRHPDYTEIKLLSIGPLFVNTIKLHHPIRPVFEWGWTQEIDKPYRKSKTCLVIWIPFVPLALAFGVWGEPQTREDVNKAMGIRDIAQFSDLPVGTMSKDVKEW